MEKIQPLGVQLLVEADPTQDKTDSGIIIPEQAKEKEKPNRGTVISVGEKIENIKPGDRVLFGKFAGTEVVTEEKKYLIMKYQDLFAILKA